MSEMYEPIPFSLDQITSPTNRSNPQSGDPMPTLIGRRTLAVALRGRNGEALAETQLELAYSLRTPGGGSSHQLISSTEASPARTSAWPADGPVLGESAAVNGLSSSGCCANCGHDGQLLRMSPDFYPAVMVQTSPSSSPRWMTSGSMRRGRYWTRSTSESRNAAGACSLSQVLEGEVPSKYFLSARAAVGILRRAERRGNALPEHLQQALSALAESTAETTQAGDTLET